MSFRPDAFLAVGLFVTALSACSPPAVTDPFDDTGELIALSGGDAGPASACHTCHGLDGEGNGALVPRIAGLDAGYIVRQLGFYADGQRTHPQMSWLAGRLDPQEHLAVAMHYAAMSTRARPSAKNRARTCSPHLIAELYHEGAAGRGLSSCASCHGSDGYGIGAGNPPLAGQPAPYLAKQLRDWREGNRYGDAGGAMHRVASRLREDEINPLADYIAHGLEPSGRQGYREECR